VLFVVACEGGPETYKISGAVTFDGQAIEKGEIIFVAVEKELGPDVGMIKNGKYEARVKAGKKRVEIRASREAIGKKNPMGPVYEDYIPACYNSRSTLTADIAAGGKKQWDFHLVSDAK
jgi:hypothetical protein